ncbi:MAG: MerR family transcriptional regulator [Desulfatiglandales bacterium]
MYSKYTMENFLIGETAKKAGIHVNTVRRLERKGLISSYRDGNGWRRYSTETVEKIRNFYGLTNSEVIGE